MMLVTAAILLLCTPSVRACTAIGVTRGATADGSTLVSHSSDAEGGGDPRLKRVDAAKHAPGAQRPVYANVAGVAGSESAQLRLLGYIPQVARTHGFFHEVYGMQNDALVSVGESTASSASPVDAVKPTDRGGRALLGVVTLIELGLERCGTAECAVRTMGALAEAHGFYQDEGTPTGEALLVGDTNEVWIFHVLPPLSADGEGAIWCAQRVPNGHVVALANMFVIREVELSAPMPPPPPPPEERPAEGSGSPPAAPPPPPSAAGGFLYSVSMLGAARSLGWKEGTLLDFTATFAPSADFDAAGGEYGGKFYSGRRVWRALSLLGAGADAAALPADYANLALDAPYPATIAASSLTPAHVMAAHRDYYQGTPFDLSRGPASGRWGTPNRHQFPEDGFNKWERPISLYRTVVSYVSQARGWLPPAVGGTIWFGPHAAHGTVYVPIANGMGASLPAEYADFDMAALDRASSYWAHVSIQALAEGRFEWISAEVRALQAVLEADGLAARAASDAAAPFLGSNAAALAAPLLAHATAVRERLWSFFEQLVFKYADGFVRQSITLPPVGTGYARPWLKEVGYAGGEPSAIPLAPRLELKDVPMLASQPPPAAKPEPRCAGGTPAATLEGLVTPAGGGAPASGGAPAGGNAPADGDTPPATAAGPHAGAERPAGGAGPGVSALASGGLALGVIGVLALVVARRGKAPSSEPETREYQRMGAA